MGSDVTTIIILIGSLLISMSVHEAMHAYVSHWLGDDTAYQMGRLTLNPLAHIDPITTLALPIIMVLAGAPPLAAAKPVPFNPHRVRFDEYGVALVGISGPLTNLLLAIVSGLWLRFVIGFESGIASEIFAIFMVLNVALFVFNMIPYPPLDGSRLLFSVAPDWLRNLMRAIERTGFTGFIIFFLIFYQLIASTIADVINWIIDLIVGGASIF